MQYNKSAICGLLEPVLSRGPSFSSSMRRKKLEDSWYEIEQNHKTPVSQCAVAKSQTWRVLSNLAYTHLASTKASNFGFHSCTHYGGAPAARNCELVHYMFANCTSSMCTPALHMLCLLLSGLTYLIFFLGLRKHLVWMLKMSRCGLCIRYPKSLYGLCF